MQTLVIKYGGNAIDGADALSAFARTIAHIQRPDRRIILVHGGGPQINHWLDKTATHSHFVNGQRYTDQAALDVVEMALAAHVNKALVRALQQAGVNACGISGEDGQLLTATPTPELGLVGQIERVNPALIHTLLSGGYLPVIAPLALSAQYQLLNINADFSAAHIAASLAADHFVLMTNVPGILDGNKQRIAQANAAELDELTAQGVIYGGMIPKVHCARIALQGAQSAAIIDGTDPQTLVQLLENPGSVGSTIRL